MKETKQGKAKSGYKLLQTGKMADEESISENEETPVSVEIQLGKWLSLTIFCKLSNGDKTEEQKWMNAICSCI